MREGMPVFTNKIPLGPTGGAEKIESTEAILNGIHNELALGILSLAREKEIDLATLDSFILENLPGGPQDIARVKTDMQAEILIKIKELFTPGKFSANPDGRKAKRNEEAAILRLIKNSLVYED